MTTLPMRNVGSMTRAQLNALIRQFPQNQIHITTSDLMVKVFSSAGTEVLSAAFIRRDTWHVRAREGLVSAK